MLCWEDSLDSLHQLILYFSLSSLSAKPSRSVRLSGVSVAPLEYGEILSMVTLEIDSRSVLLIYQTKGLPSRQDELKYSTIAGSISGSIGGSLRMSFMIVSLLPERYTH